MMTVSEIKKTAHDDWIWILLIFIFLTCSFIFINNIVGRVVVGSLLAWLLLILLQKRTLKLTVDNADITVEQSVGWFINRIKKTELNSKDINYFLIWGPRYYYLEFGDKKGNRTVMQFMDVHNRAEAIKLLLPILQDKPIKLDINTTIYDPAFEDLKQLIENKYSVTPNKFKSSFCFDGKTYT